MCHKYRCIYYIYVGYLYYARLFLIDALKSLHSLVSHILFLRKWKFLIKIFVYLLYIFKILFTVEFVFLLKIVFYLLIEIFLNDI